LIVVQVKLNKVVTVNTLLRLLNYSIIQNPFIKRHMLPVSQTRDVSSICICYYS